MEMEQQSGGIAPGHTASRHLRRPFVTRIASMMKRLAIIPGLALVHALPALAIDFQACGELLQQRRALLTQAGTQEQLYRERALGSQCPAKQYLRTTSEPALSGSFSNFFSISTKTSVDSEKLGACLTKASDAFEATHTPALTLKEGITLIRGEQPVSPYTAMIFNAPLTRIHSPAAARLIIQANEVTGTMRSMTCPYR
jgi:hypothetical protein